MATKNVSIIFDRQKKAIKNGRGKVEIRVYLSANVRKYIVVGETTKAGFKSFQNNLDIISQIEQYEEIVRAMKLLGEDMTIDNFNYHVNGETEQNEVSNPSKRSFVEFIESELKREKLREGTMKHKKTVVESLQTFGKIKTFADLTPTNIRAYDGWLRDTGDRSDVTIWGYHKRIKKYTRILKLNGLIPADPYETCKFTRGRTKERKPLIEKELIAMRKAKLSDKLDRVRDLFVFSAYTGLAYADAQVFDFHKVTEKIGKMYYIDGSRIKTGTSFYTPILKPAMEVLKKYNYKLPRISNQKANEYLHVIEEKLELNKSLTTHIARHSFATLALSNDIPVENVARMLGHTDIRTTQIYAKILHTTIERHSEKLQKRIR